MRFAAATFFIIHPCHVSDRSGVAAHSDGKGQQVDLASSGHLDTQTNAMRMLRVPTPANTAYCLSFRPFLTSMKRPPRCCGLNAMRAPSVVAVPIVGRYESGEQEAEVLGKVRTLLDNVMAAQ